jgi:hypothetical protein
LDEGLFFGKLLNGFGRVAADGKAMDDAGVEVDLPWEWRKLAEDGFRFMALFYREDGVGLCGSEMSVTSFLVKEVIRLSEP